MAVTIQGTIKNGGAYNVNGKKGQQVMISFTVADEVGNLFSCQMWPDDPQHQQLAQAIERAQRQPVHCTVAGFSVRKRMDKQNQEKLQANFIVTGVTIPNLVAPATTV
jgi:hypothetical protein